MLDTDANQSGHDHRLTGEIPNRVNAPGDGPVLEQGQPRNLSSPSIKWVVMRDWPQVESVWRDLETGALQTPFQRYEWLRSYDREFNAPNIKRAFVVAYAGRSPVALFPLCVKTSLGVRQMEWFGQNLSDYNAPLVLNEWLKHIAPADVAQIWSAIVKCVGNVDVCRLSGQPAMLGDQPNPFAVFSSDIEAASAHSLSLGSDWDTFAAKTFSRSTLRRLKEKRRRLDKEGPVEFVWHKEQSERAKVAATILDWKCAQLSATGGRNPFSDFRAREFVAGAASDSPHDAFDVLSLSLNGQPIAGILALKTDRGRLIYQMAYALGPATRNSPGQLLLHELMRHMIGNGEQELDFTVGDEPYKVALCDQHRKMRLSIKSFTRKGALASRAIQFGNGLKRKIKSNDVMMKALQTARKQTKNVIAWLAARRSNIPNLTR